MKTKKTLILVLIATLLLGSAGAAYAISSPNFNLPKNSNEGGGAGGATASSANYQMTGTLGGSLQVSSTSSHYKLCSGFLCGGSRFLKINVFLPVSLRSFP